MASKSIGQQLIRVKLSPRLDETLLLLQNEPDNKSDGRDGKDRHRLAIIGMEMRDMMLL